MNIIDLIRLLRRHLVILLGTPVLMAGLVYFLTRKPDFKYASETTLYTGIATGSSVEMDKSFNYFATNTAFDNLINVIKSRETQQELSIRLLAQHLMLSDYDPRYISSKSFENLKRITPDYIRALVVKSAPNTAPPIAVADSVIQKDSIKTFSFSDLASSSGHTLTLPPGVNQSDYEKTVEKLTDFMTSSDTNFVYRLLNFEDIHYSIKSISTINVQRIGSSDLVKLKYETDDPGICQQTLALLNEVFIKNYKDIKENRSDAVVKYFEFQLKQASARLKVAEEKLLKFNKDNNIINYYEQSKAVAVVKEDLDVEYNNKRIKLAGLQAAIKRLEDKLGVQEQIQLKSNTIIEMRNQLSDLNYKIVAIETFGMKNSDNDKLVNLKIQAEKLKDAIKLSVGEFYSYGNSREGLPLNTLLNDWINNVIEAENLKAGIEVLGERIKEFQKQYAIYAPAGANIKRIEREINVSEQEFLEILHGLGLAKLKMQDNELASNIKAVDPPFFPLSPIPTKRNVLIILAGMVGFILVFTFILILEYFDSTLKNQTKAGRILKLPFLGVFPKILHATHKINFTYITNRLLEIAIQHIELYLKISKSDSPTKTLLFFSTTSNEGKSVIVGNIARKLKDQGKKILLLKFSRESIRQAEIAYMGYPEILTNSSSAEPEIKQRRRSIISWLLGYPDTRIDFRSSFLSKPESYLTSSELITYNVDESFYSVKNYKDILRLNGTFLEFIPDFVLIELPPILYYPYPVGLLSGIDLPILICRANRAWSEADQGVLDIFMNLTEQKTHFILNGVELPVIESVLGDLPKKRSRLRKIIKNFFRFQFFSKNHL